MLHALEKYGSPLGYAGEAAEVRRLRGDGIQGRPGAIISHLSGSYSGVMGLPVHETARYWRRRHRRLRNRVAAFRRRIFTV